MNNRIIGFGYTTKTYLKNYGYNDARSYHDTIERITPDWKAHSVITDIPNNINSDTIISMYTKLYKLTHDIWRNDISFKILYNVQISNIKKIKYSYFLDLYNKINIIMHNDTASQIDEINNNYNDWLINYIKNNDIIKNKKLNITKQIQSLEKENDKIISLRKEMYMMF